MMQEDSSQTIVRGGGLATLPWRANNEAFENETDFLQISYMTFVILTNKNIVHNISPFQCAMWITICFTHTQILEAVYFWFYSVKNCLDFPNYSRQPMKTCVRLDFQVVFQLALIGYCISHYSFIPDMHFLMFQLFQRLRCTNRSHFWTSPQRHK